MANEVLPAHAGYSRDAFNQTKLVDWARRNLEPYTDKYDVLVGTGLSGAMVVSLLAYTLGKRFMIVRKPDDKNNHSQRRFEGMLAKEDRILFVDDFISSGRTIKTMLETLRDHAREWQLRYVGRYEYAGDGQLTLETSARWGVTLNEPKPEPKPEPARVTATEIAEGRPAIRARYPSILEEYARLDSDAIVRMQADFMSRWMRDIKWMPRPEDEEARITREFYNG
jgi:hypothetical protein